MYYICNFNLQAYTSRRYKAMNVNEEISRIKKNHIPSERVLKRTKYEKEARKFLSDIQVVKTVL